MSESKITVSTPLSPEQHNALVSLAKAKGKTKAATLRDLIPVKRKSRKP